MGVDVAVIGEAVKSQPGHGVGDRVIGGNVTLAGRRRRLHQPADDRVGRALLAAVLPYPIDRGGFGAVDVEPRVGLRDDVVDKGMALGQRRGQVVVSNDKIPHRAVWDRHRDVRAWHLQARPGAGAIQRPVVHHSLLEIVWASFQIRADGADVSLGNRRRIEAVRVRPVEHRAIHGIAPERGREEEEARIGDRCHRSDGIESALVDESRRPLAHVRRADSAGDHHVVPGVSANAGHAVIEGEHRLKTERLGPGYASKHTRRGDDGDGEEGVHNPGSRNGSRHRELFLSKGCNEVTRDMDPNGQSERPTVHTPGQIAPNNPLCNVFKAN